MSALRSKLLVAVALVAGGFALARLAGSSSPTSPVVTEARVVRDDRALDELRRELAELRGQQRAQVTIAPSVARPEPVPPAEPTTTQLESAAVARALIDRARTARRWTEKDAGELRDQLANLTSSQRDDTMLALTAAINRDEIVPDGPLL
jgi:hypothetical protein